MDLDALSQQQLEQYEADLLGRVPANAAIGNKTLRSSLLALGWSESLYWHVRNRLIERGVLTTGRGKGGSVRSAVVVEGGAPLGGTDARTTSEASECLAERDLYGPMADVIRNHWAPDYRFDATAVEVTAQQGARVTGGKWTRPDITVAGYKTLPYVPGRHFDVITFEIKPADGIDVTVVYEALGHRRAATRAYALLHVPEGRREGVDTLITEIVAEAKRFGIGVLVAADPGDYDSWEELTEAVRHEPDPERLNDFLAQQVSQEFRERVIRWFR